MATKSKTQSAPTTSAVSLVDRIKTAPNISSILSLVGLAESREYRFAGSRFRRRVQNAALLRQRELKSEKSKSKAEALAK